MFCGGDQDKLNPRAGTHAVVFPSSPDNEGAEVQYGPGLSKAQLLQTKELVQQSLDVFSVRPGRTTIVEHQIHTEPDQTVSTPAPNTANWERVEPPVGNGGASHYPASQPLTHEINICQKHI